MSEDRPWYESAFRSDYLDLYPHRDLTTARAEVSGLLARELAPEGARVLDLGCGFGRHSLALREAGRRVFGLDLSRDLLAHARALPGFEPLVGRLVRGDFRRLPFGRAAFDAVTMLFSSFGYFDEVTNAAVLDEVARVLRPGGQAVFDLMNPARIRAQLVPESRTERDGIVLEERRRLEQGGRRVVKQVRRVNADGRERRWREDVGLFETREFARLCEASGLEYLRVEGDFDGRAFDDEAPRQIIWTCRRGGEG